MKDQTAVTIMTQPTEMLAITIQTYAEPSDYELSTTSRPRMSQPDEVLIQIYAASVNPVDIKKASGQLKLALSES